LSVNPSKEKGMYSGKRKRYFIRKDFQSRFILRFVAATAVWGVTTVLLFVFLAGRKLDDLRYSSHIDLQTTSELLLPITAGVHAASLLIFAGILTYTIHTLWHKLSGPLTGLKKSLVRIADGDLTGRVVLRKEDEFQYLARDLEVMRSGLREKIVGLKERQRELSAAAAELAASIPGGDRLPARVAALQSAVDRMQEELHAFHGESDASPAANRSLTPHENRS
jgi:methyl-accepting chemotaxis protein